MRKSRLASLVLLGLMGVVAVVEPAAAKGRQSGGRKPLTLKVPTQQSVCEAFRQICMDTNATELECLNVYYTCMSPQK